MLSATTCLTIPSALSSKFFLTLIFPPIYLAQKYGQKICQENVIGFVRCSKFLIKATSIVIQIRMHSVLNLISYIAALPSIAPTDRNGRMFADFSGHGAKCVKRRAELSVKANPNCADKAGEYVDAAFERCYKDTFPFDRHPNLR